MSDQMIERGACPDCLGVGYRIGADVHGRELIEVEHDDGCPFKLTGGAS